MGKKIALDIWLHCKTCLKCAAPLDALTEKEKREGVLCGECKTKSEGKIMNENQMNEEEKQAYEWAIKQSYQSIAARYARTLAKFIKRNFVPPVEENLCPHNAKRIDCTHCDHMEDLASLGAKRTNRERVNDGGDDEISI